MTIKLSENWEVKIQPSSKGTLYAMLYYKGVSMGFVNFASPEVQKMLYTDICPEVVEQAKQIHEEYVKSRYDKKC